MKQTDLDLLIRLQPKIKEAMGNILNYDRVYSQKTELTECVPDFMRAYVLNHSDYILIPPAFPTLGDRPERSLWGMIKGYKKIEQNNEAKVVIQTYNNAQGGWKEITADDPYTAMLMALCEQEGV